MKNEGTKGIGTRGYSKYDQSNAKPAKNGRNDAKHDHIVTKISPMSANYGKGNMKGVGNG